MYCIKYCYFIFFIQFALLFLWNFSPTYTKILDPPLVVLVSLAQLVWTMHNICKVQGSNPEHHKKKDSHVISIYFYIRYGFEVGIYISTTATYPYFKIGKNPNSFKWKNRQINMSLVAYPRVQVLLPCLSSIRKS